METYFSEKNKNVDVRRSYIEMSTMDAFNCSNCNLKYEPKVDDDNAFDAAAATALAMGSLYKYYRISKLFNNFQIVPSKTEIPYNSFSRPK